VSVSLWALVWVLVLGKHGPVQNKKVLQKNNVHSNFLGMGPGALELFAPFRILRRIPEGEVISGVERVKACIYCWW
jgi:hypothetical protein